MKGLWIGVIALFLACIFVVACSFGSIPQTGAAPLTTPTVFPCPTATPEPLWVEPVTSPTTLTAQIVDVHIGNGETVTITSEAGRFTSVALQNRHLVTVTLLPNTVHQLNVTGQVRRVDLAPDCWLGGYTLSSTQDRNGKALVIVQQTTISPTLTPTATLLEPALVIVTHGFRRS